MPTYRFAEVPVYAEKSVPCTVCGKKVRRQKKFAQTLNPFNKDAQGRPKTSGQIRVELRAEADAWKAEPETHPKCEAGGSDA